MLTVLIACAFATVNYGPTHHPDDRRFRFVVYGDTRRDAATDGTIDEGPKIHEQIVRAICDIKPRAEAIFQTGDLISGYSAKTEWPEFDRIIVPIKNRYFPARGNHDSGKEFLKYTPRNRSYYSLVKNKLRFLVLDTEQTFGTQSPEYLWLERQLASAKKRGEAAIPIFHRALFSIGLHGSSDGKDSKPDLQTPLDRLFRLYGVKIVFQGHDHLYYRTIRNGIIYVVTGGGGAPLYDFNHGKNFNAKTDVRAKLFHYCVCDAYKKEIRVRVWSLKYEYLDAFTVALD